MGRARGEESDSPDDDDAYRLLSAQPTLPDPAPYVPRTRKWALVTVVAVSFALAAWIASPLWVPVLVGFVMALSAQGPYRMLARRFGARHARMSAALVTLGSGIVVATIGTIVLFSLTQELMKIVAHLDLQAQSGSGTLSGLIGERAAHFVANMGVDAARVYRWIRGELEAAASYAATMGAVVLRTTSFAVLGLVVSLMTMYYVLIEGPSLARRIERVAPLEPRHTRMLLEEAREVGRTAFIGTIATAAVQGVIAGAGYAALGAPQPVTWALATALASFMPIIGTALVWVPVSGYLLVEGHPARAILLVVWGIVAITGLADYVIRPRIVGSRGHGHPLLTLLALLGGIEVLGLPGLLVAPIVMSVFVAAFRLYEREALRTLTAPGGLTPAVRNNTPSSRTPS